eukprot:XP_797466.3 PREDICTED: uncharacterized protein LOC592869 isoform X1 [Strongylocentrotus purpuratus]
MTISNRKETSQSIQAGNFCTLRLVKMKEPELPGSGGGEACGVEEPEPQWKRYSDSRRRANAAYEERKKCVDVGRTRRSRDLRGSRKRVVLSDETFQRWNIVKLKEFVESTNDEFASSLLDRYEEHSENCSTFSVGNTEDSDSESDAPSLPFSVGSTDATRMSDSAKKRKRKARDLRYQAKHNPKNMCVFNDDLEEIRTIGKEKHLTDKKVISLLLATFLHTKKSVCVDQATQTMPDVYSCSHCGSSPPAKPMPPLARPQPSGPQQIRLVDRASNPLSNGPKTPNIKVIMVKKSTAGVLKRDSLMTPQALNNLMQIGSNVQAAHPLQRNLTGSSQSTAGVLKRDSLMTPQALNNLMQIGSNVQAAHPLQRNLTGSSQLPARYIIQDIPGSTQVVKMEPVESMEDFEQLPNQEFSQAKCIDEKDNTEDYIYDDGSTTLDDGKELDPDKKLSKATDHPVGVVVKEEVLSDLEQSNLVHSDMEESFFDPRQDQEFGSDSKLVYSEPGWYGREEEDMVEEEGEDEIEDDEEDDEEIDYEAQELFDPTHDLSASMPQHSTMNSKDIPGSSKSSKCLGGRDSLESDDSLEYGGDSDEDFDFQFPEACPICSEAWEEKPEIMHHLQKHIPIDKGPEAIKDAVQLIKSKFEKGHKFDMGWCWECKELLLGFRTHYNRCHNNNPTCIVMCNCKQCGKMIRSSYIKIHEISHLDIKESDYVQCPECPSRFKHRIFLKGHIKKFHFKKALRDLQCSTCGKIFKSWQQLQRHSLIHSGLKPYSCSMCDRSFIQKNSLKIHMRQHTGDKPYVCEVCEKAFTHKISLKNHKKKQHGIDWWKEQRKIQREIKAMALNRENK